MMHRFHSHPAQHSVRKACLKEGKAAGGGTAAKWNHSKFWGLPGQRWDATAQCTLYLKDKDAGLPNNAKINVSVLSHASLMLESLVLFFVHPWETGLGLQKLYIEKNSSVAIP